MENKTNIKNGALIIALSRALQRIHKKSELLFYQNDLTMAQFMVLEALYHKGNLTIKEIISAVLSSSGTITVVIRNLERRGLVVRLNNPADKRSFLIQITPAGRELITPLYDRHMEYVAEAVAPLTEEEKSHLITILKKLK